MLCSRVWLTKKRDARFPIRVPGFEHRTVRMMIFTFKIELYDKHSYTKIHVA